MGDSAGGGLVLSVLGAAKAEGLPLPAGGILWSPWVDLTGIKFFFFLHNNLLIFVLFYVLTL